MQTSKRDEIREIIATTSKYNYTRAIQARRDLASYVEGETQHLSGLSFAARVHYVLSGEGPICSKGKTRPFLNIDNGWGFCGKGKACACLVEERAAVAKRSYAERKAVAEEARASLDVLDDEIARSRLEKLITDNARNYSKLIANDPALYAWVHTKSDAHVSDGAKISERCYIALHGPLESICPRGQKRKFYSIIEGYEGSCESDSHCACRRQAQSEIISQHQSEVSDTERSRRDEAARLTLQERYGVSYPAHVPGVQEKSRQTSQERYGTDHPMQNTTIKQRHGDLFEALYGVRTPGASSKMQAKARATNLDRYGETHTMALARKAYIEQSGFENPFQDPANQKKAAESMMDRYGVLHPLQSELIMSTMRENLLETYGVENVMKLETVRDKLRSSVLFQYGPEHWNQAHFSDDAISILNDAELFRDLFKDRSLRDVAAYLGIAYDTARKYCYRHGVPLPKSSYETAIKAFLESLDVGAIQQGNRSIIKPKELDFVIPAHKLAIEFNGLYFHRDSHIAKAVDPDLVDCRHYHRNKLIAAESAGYRLITIFEDEWVNKQEIVKARLRHALGRSTRGPGARACLIVRIPHGIAKEFLETHHIQGGGVAGFANYGAYHNDQLVAVMTFTKGRLGVGNKRMEMLRFATDGRNLPGIAARLFKSFIHEYKPTEVVSFADRRWSQGNLYRTLGFNEESPGSPGYFYIDCTKIIRFHRMKAQKNKIVHLIDDGESRSEKEIMHELGYEIIYDCGSYLFSWKPS